MGRDLQLTAVLRNRFTYFNYFYQIEMTSYFRFPYRCIFDDINLYPCVICIIHTLLYYTQVFLRFPMWPPFLYFLVLANVLMYFCTLQVLFVVIQLVFNIHSQSFSQNFTSIGNIEENDRLSGWISSVDPENEKLIKGCRRFLIPWGTSQTQYHGRIEKA